VIDRGGETAQEQCNLNERPIDRCLTDEISHFTKSISNTSWSTDEEHILMEPYHYLETRPGKDFRSQFMHAFNEWLQVPARSLSVIIRVVGMLHTASLLIDDIQDDSQLRRGAPVAHDVFGTAQTINSANYVYFCALKDLSTLENPELIRIYTEELLNLHRGQGMDLFWRDTSTCPTETDYIRMVSNKTGGLFRLAIKLMCAESTSTQHEAKLMTLVNSIGVLFQILDDYRNLTDSLYEENKGLCEDLTEGKFSFPIMHAIRSDPGSSYLLDILRKKNTDDTIKRNAVSYIEQRGSFLYTREVIRRLRKDVLRLVDEVEASQAKSSGCLKHILEKFVL